MEKRATVKDVAKAAGVSVATVSYIMNNKPGQKISDETKKKVLQIANLLNYTPSYAAKSLATGKNNIIGISYHLNKRHPSRCIETTNFINMLIERFNRMHYDVIFVPYAKPDEIFIPNQRVDAVIAIDLSDEEFRILADNYLVPVICNDILIDDFLFYQIYYNFPSAISDIEEKIGNDSFILLEPYSNENYMTYITQNINTQNLILLNDINSFDVKSVKKNKFIIIGAYLALMLRPYIPDENMYVITTNHDYKLLPDSINHTQLDSSKKANLTINITLNAINRNFDIEHKYSV